MMYFRGKKYRKKQHGVKMMSDADLSSSMDNAHPQGTKATSKGFSGQRKPASLLLQQ
jgi:hypothetical protein